MELTDLDPKVREEFVSKLITDVIEAVKSGYKIDRAESTSFSDGTKGFAILDLPGGDWVSIGIRTYRRAT